MYANNRPDAPPGPSDIKFAPAIIRKKLLIFNIISSNDYRMNRKYLFAAIMSAVFLCAFAAAGFRVLRQNPRYAQKRACREVETMQQEKVLRDGDLIFQTSLSGQSRAIQEATGSKYSHCGIIYRDGCDYFVYEAVQPVKSTPLAQWIARGKGGHYVVKRLAGADSSPNETSRRCAGKPHGLPAGITT